MNAMTMRNQKVLLPALRVQGEERFQVSAACGALRVGVADRPFEQKQPDEVVEWSAASVLVSGVPGSGLTTLLRTAVWQFASEESPCRIAVLDPTSADPASWHCVVAGPAAWLVMDQTASAIVQVIEQVEALAVSPLPGQRALVAVDRLDRVVMNLDQLMLARLAKLISGASRSGIAFICTSDARTSLEGSLRTAFGVRYRYVDPDSHLLEREDPAYLVRPFVAVHERPAHPVDADLPLGPVRPHHLAAAKARRTLADDHVVLGVDGLTHAPVETPVTEPLVVTGGSPHSRSALLHWHARELDSRGLAVGAIGTPDQVGDLPDIIGTLAAHYDLVDGETPDAKVESVLRSFQHVFVFEVGDLLRTLRSRTSDLPRTDAAAAIHSAITQKLGKGQLGVIAHGGFRIPPFQSIDWSVAQLQLSTWVYLDPKPEIQIPGTGGGALEKALVAARPHHRYGADEAVCLLEGVRHEIRVLHHDGGVQHGQ